MEEDLCLEFARTQLSFHNPTSFSFYLGVGGGLFSKDRIYTNTCIGEIQGTPEFLHDMTHFDYIQIDQEYALDVTTVVPRSILTWIRGEYFTQSQPNCEIRVEVNEHTRESRFYVWSFHRIDVDEELVYRIPTS